MKMFSKVAWLPIAAVVMFFVPLHALAQPEGGEGPAAALIASGIEAFRAENFAQALSDFEAAVAAEPDNPEAHFLLARVLFDTPLRDEGRAGDEIGIARDLDPENLRYMVAELQQLRTETWNFFQELIRTRQRLTLAREILERDPENGFAHEEFGQYYIRDFWHYRNAIALPGLGFYTPTPGGGDFSDEAIVVLPNDPTNTGDTQSPLPPLLLPGSDEISGLNNRFDLEALKAQNVAVQDLSGRADRAYQAAIGHLERALASDPRRRPVYDDMMRLYALAGEYEEALNMLSQMLVFFPDDPQMWMYLGLANHWAKHGDAAATSFRMAMERLSPEEKAAYDDLTLLLPIEEHDAYRENPEAVAAQFWTSKDPRYLTPYNERKLEHYARLTYADLLYKSDDLDLRGWETERGRIFVRYGRPINEVLIRGDFASVLHVFNERVAEFYQPFAADLSNVFNVWDYGDFQFVFEDPQANGEFRLYSPPADLFATNGAAGVDRMDYQLIASRTFRETPEIYTFEAPGRRTGLPYLVTSFKGTEGRTDVFVHYGIPIVDGFDPSSNDVVDLTVRTGAFLINESREVLVERRRTLYGLRSPQIERFSDTQLWTDTQEMEAPPGVHEVSVEFETAGGGTSAVQRREIVVPDFSGSGLSLSSLMLAYHVEDTDAASVPGQIVRGGLAIKPAPWSVFNREQPIFLFFEIYNLSQNGSSTDYQVEAQLRPKDTSSGIARIARSIFGGGSDRGVSTEYPVQGDRRDDSQYVILDAAEQEPGLYTLTLRITDRLSGNTVEETTDLFLE